MTKFNKAGLIEALEHKIGFNQALIDEREVKYEAALAHWRATVVSRLVVHVSNYDPTKNSDYNYFGRSFDPPSKDIASPNSYIEACKRQIAQLKLIEGDTVQLTVKDEILKYAL